MLTSIICIFTIASNCIVWDTWVNEGHVSLTSGGDSEPIATIQRLSEMCTNPIMIECARASDGLPYDQAGQKVRCDLWNGLSCFNADNTPSCFDYKARLGCLKYTPECCKRLPSSLKNVLDEITCLRFCRFNVYELLYISMFKLRHIKSFCIKW